MSAHQTINPPKTELNWNRNMTNHRLVSSPGIAFSSQNLTQTLPRVFTGKSMKRAILPPTVLEGVQHLPPADKSRRNKQERSGLHFCWQGFLGMLLGVRRPPWSAFISLQNRVELKCKEEDADWIMKVEILRSAAQEGWGFVTKTVHVFSQTNTAAEIAGEPSRLCTCCSTLTWMKLPSPVIKCPAWVNAGSHLLIVEYSCFSPRP